VSRGEGWEQPDYASMRAAHARTLEPPPTRYASWGRRLAAALLDTVFLTGAILAALLVLGFVTAALGTEEDEGWLLALLVLIVFAGPFVYYTMMIGARGQTFGKKLLRVAVRDADSIDHTIGYGRAFGRYLMTTLFWLLLYVPGILDALWPLWDRRKQTWHDKVVRSVVVRV